MKSKKLNTLYWYQHGLRLRKTKPQTLNETIKFSIHSLGDNFEKHKSAKTTISKNKWRREDNRDQSWWKAEEDTRYKEHTLSFPSCTNSVKFTSRQQYIKGYVA